MHYVKFISKLSNIFGYIIIWFTGFFYVQKLIVQPIEIVTNIALTAIGIIAALSALCFSFVPCISDEKTKKSGLYAGEKFLHSTLLIILTLFLKFSIDQLLTFDLIKNTTWLRLVILIIFNISIIGIGGFAVTMAALGFDNLNSTLWTRYENNAKLNLKK